ncbi:hypothetical protein D3C85_1343280 [compost metagenome]
MLRAERHPAIAVAKHRTAHLSGVVFQRKVPMAGRGLREIRYLSADPNLSHFLLEQQTNRLIEAAYGIN